MPLTLARPSSPANLRKHFDVRNLAEHLQGARPLFEPAKLVGFIDRQGIPPGSDPLTWSNHTFNSILGGFVMRGTAQSSVLLWSALQTAAGSPAGTGAISGADIDSAFDMCDAYNATGPARPWRLLLRVSGGEDAPTWAKNLGLGPITNGDPTPILMPVWWDEASGFGAWKNFMLTLANYVPSYTVRATGLANTQKLDGHPLLGKVAEQACMTKFAEPFTKDDFNTGAPAGQAADAVTRCSYTFAADIATHKLAMKWMSIAWPNTVWTCSFNPASNIETGGPNDEVTTELMIDYEVLSAKAIWPRLELYNNSLRANGLVYPPPIGAGPFWDTHDAGSPGKYTSMYQALAAYAGNQAYRDMGPTNSPWPFRPPLSFQTSTLTGMGNTKADLIATIVYAIWLGARSIELPSGYGGVMNPSDFTSPTDYIAQMILNDPTVALVQAAGPVTIARDLLVITTSVANLIKKVSKEVDVVEADAPTLVKQVNKPLSVVSVDVVSLTASHVFNKALSVVSVDVPVLLKQVGKLLSVTTSSVVALVKQDQKRLSVVETDVPTLVKQDQKVLSVAESDAPTLTKTVGKVLGVVSVDVVSLVASRAVLKALSVVTVSVPTLAKSVGKNLVVVSASVPVLLKTVGKVLSVVGVDVPTLTKRAQKVLAVVSTDAPVIQKQVGKTLAVVSVSAVSLVKRIGKVISVVSSTIASLLRLLIPGANAPTSARVDVTVTVATRVDTTVS